MAWVGTGLHTVPSPIHPNHHHPSPLRLRPSYHRHYSSSLNKRYAFLRSKSNSHFAPFVNSFLYLSLESFQQLILEDENLTLQRKL